MIRVKNLEPYSIDRGISAESVPLTVIILAKNEVVNIGKAISSARWANQTIVVDSGSTDGTQDLAKSLNADVVETVWRGFGPQRDFALQFKNVENEWVLFLDADEWVSSRLAAEIANRIRDTDHSGFEIGIRLIFMDRWISHCGWYPGPGKLVLLRRSHAKYGAQEFSERAAVIGSIDRLKNDIVDEDRKGLSAWLYKHVGYAALELERRLDPNTKRTGRGVYGFLKNTVAPKLPGRPGFQFIYMYIIKRGFLDGWQGFTFCILHAWFQFVILQLSREKILAGEKGISTPLSESIPRQEV